MRWIVVATLLLIPVVPAAADETLFEELKRRTRSDAFQIHSIVQVVGIAGAQTDRVVNNGFALANFRFGLSGELDDDIGYYFQANFVNSPAVLYANISYKPTRALGIRAGAQKAPFSAEFLTSVSGTDFVDRSQVVRALAAGAQIGAELYGVPVGGLSYRIGAFNGNGVSSLVNDDQNLLVAGRLAYATPATETGARITLGGNAYYSDDTDARLGVPITGDFIASGYTGLRRAAGVDLRLTHPVGFLAAEGIVSRFDPRGGTRVEPYGYYVTAAWFPHTKTQLLVRWDSFRPDGVLDDSDLILLGLNYFPSTPVELQLNAIFPTLTDEFAPRVIANFQIAF